MCASSVFAGQEAAKQTAGPSLSETTQWIQSHLSGLSHTRRETVVDYKSKKGKPPREVQRQVINTHELVSVVSFDGCSLTLGQLRKGDDYSIVTVSVVPMEKLLKASWKVEENEGSKSQTGEDSREITISPPSQAALTLETSPGAIAWKRKSTGSVPLDLDGSPFEGSSASLVIHSDDQAMPPRLVNAFTHAMQLCHVNVKPEPF
jgi:hypothetical protein